MLYGFMFVILYIHNWVFKMAPLKGTIYNSYLKSSFLPFHCLSFNQMYIHKHACLSMMIHKYIASRRILLQATGAVFHTLLFAKLIIILLFILLNSQRTNSVNSLRKYIFSCKIQHQNKREVERLFDSRPAAIFELPHKLLPCHAKGLSDKLQS